MRAIAPALSPPGIVAVLDAAQAKAPTKAAATHGFAWVLVVTGTLRDPVGYELPLTVAQEGRTIERHPRAERRARADLLPLDALAGPTGHDDRAAAVVAAAEQRR